ncbi:MAG TPA: G/U mismatch-specific DNA glycosylase [Polyangiaceae bacterium]|jgi:TDG/mug DNA glycosylase family protein|nr:G/U mismatch-specific DNA glycosylase [Polyangiaceae bacterium]
MILPRKPTQQEILAAAGKTVPDVIARGLDVLFCGINPGLYTAAVGHHFARPGNRFWPTLHASGFTPRVLSPYEERELLKLGCGITNVVDRASAAADELSAEELANGGERLRAKVLRYQPRFLAVLGIGAYRSAFAKPRATIGLQPEVLGDTRLWVLPNPSGLNAHYRSHDFAQMFRELREAARPAQAPG